MCLSASFLLVVSIRIKCGIYEERHRCYNSHEICAELAARYQFHVIMRLIHPAKLNPKKMPGIAQIKAPC